MLFEVNNEVASTKEVQFELEPVKMIETNQMHMLVPRATRHPVKKQSPLWFMFVKSAFRFLFRGRYGYAFVKRRNKMI
ncbi:hypothetical protein D3C86_2086070 [compost metagenome]